MMQQKNGSVMTVLASSNTPNVTAYLLLSLFYLWFFALTINVFLFYYFIVFILAHFSFMR